MDSDGRNDELAMCAGSGGGGLKEKTATATSGRLNVLSTPQVTQPMITAISLTRRPDPASTSVLGVVRRPTSPVSDSDRYHLLPHVSLSNYLDLYFTSGILYLN